MILKTRRMEALPEAAAAVADQVVQPPSVLRSVGVGLLVWLITRALDKVWR